MYVRRCFSDGRFEIDNGAVERAIREPVIGRKNYLFTDSKAVGCGWPRDTLFVQSCRVLATHEYPIDIIRELEARWPARSLAELMPHRWAQLTA